MTAPRDPSTAGAWRAADVAGAAHVALAVPTGRLIRSLPTASDDADYTGRIERALGALGAPGRVAERVAGPVIVTHAIQPAPGIRASRIVGIAADVAVAAGLGPVRARLDPTAGRVVLESARAVRQTVRLGDVYDPHAPGALPITLGTDVAGVPVTIDLADAPHLMIGGTTGSGKSVLVNAILTSLILRHSPGELALVLIDPKRTELAPYAALPHLALPLAVEPWAAVQALETCVDEMESRYRKPRPGAPRIVVVVDELADLMLASRRSVEPLIVRLGQKARAAGIHLVLATQRPSVDVVTGLIKANMPTRIALRTASRVDSRVILDRPGAEALLGRGDGLLSRGGAADPVRIHGALVTPEEIAAVCRAVS